MRAEAAIELRDLRAALKAMLAESESSWRHVKVDDYCQGCGFEWPCATVRARAVIGDDA